MEKTTLTSVGGVIAAVIASLCCIGPVIVVFLGVGSVAAFSVFEAYRPYLIGLTVALIGLAFYFTYRKQEIKCEDGTCKVEGAGKLAKTGVWSATILTILAIGFPSLGFAPQSAVNKTVDSTAIVTLNISGMDCKACAAGMEGSLAGMKGVRKAKVDFENGKATLEYDAKIVKPTAFVDRVNENGFTATIKKGK
ncbi:MAG: cation transporter [Ignavibacteriales bacterium]|nr:cation transporter [Ignavibacteriales bacterium]